MGCTTFGQNLENYIISIVSKNKTLNLGSKLHPVDHGGDRHHWKRHAGGDHHLHQHDHDHRHHLHGGDRHY